MSRATTGSYTVDSSIHALPVPCLCLSLCCSSLSFSPHIYPYLVFVTIAASCRTIKISHPIRLPQPSFHHSKGFSVFEYAVNLFVPYIYIMPTNTKRVLSYICTSEVVHQILVEQVGRVLPLLCTKFLEEWHVLSSCS